MLESDNSEHKNRRRHNYYLGSIRSPTVINIAVKLLEFVLSIVFY